MAIQWDAQKMSTGFDEIDAQHKRWMNCLNEFEKAIFAGNGNESLLETLEFLRQYTNHHFSTEEFLMASLHSPILNENRCAHDQFRAKLSDISEWVRKEGASNVEIVALKLELDEWVTNHICTIDVKLRERIQSL